METNVHAIQKDLSVKKNILGQKVIFHKTVVGHISCNEQMDLLNRGIKFYIPPIKPPIEDIIVDVQSQTKGMDDVVKDTVINQSFDVLKDLHSMQCILSMNLQ